MDEQECIDRIKFGINEIKDTDKFPKFMHWLLVGKMGYFHAHRDSNVAHLYQRWMDTGVKPSDSLWHATEIKNENTSSNAAMVNSFSYATLFPDNAEHYILTALTLFDRFKKETCEDVISKLTQLGISEFMAKKSLTKFHFLNGQ